MLAAAEVFFLMHLCTEQQQDFIPCILSFVLQRTNVAVNKQEDKKCLGSNTDSKFYESFIITTHGNAIVILWG